MTEKVAQQASCIAPKAFKATLAVVRGVVASYLTEKSENEITPSSLARDYKLGKIVVYWMEQVEKALRESGEAEDLEVSEATLHCVVFYWTCTALHVSRSCYVYDRCQLTRTQIRSVKLQGLMAKYSVQLEDVQDITAVLDRVCVGVQERIDKEIATQRGTSRSPIKQQTESPKKRTFEMAAQPVTPVKRQRIQPLVDNSSRARQMSVQTDPQTSSPTKATPTRQYGTVRSIRTTPLDTSNGRTALKTPSTSPSKRSTATPTTQTVNERLDKLDLDEESDDDMPPSPTKGKTPRAGPSKLLQRTVTSPLKSHTQVTDYEAEDGVVDLDALVEKVDAAYESRLEKESRSRCPRHRRRPFADREFYLKRDLRVVREWELCEDNFKDMVKVLGYPFGQMAIR